ncbi:MAG: hypothetical protein GC164_06285 [Phycisphaera sp.]|nr:hypothetical protein [Phycisphaera sp.]
MFSLDTSVNTLGYNIANIATFSYWGDSRAMQEYTVSVSVVGDAGFTTLHALTGELGASGKVNQVTLTDNAGYLATGVDAIRFVFADIGSLNWVAYREIDVVGSAVPIP